MKLSFAIVFVVLVSVVNVCAQSPQEDSALSAVKRFYVIDQEFFTFIERTADKRDSLEECGLLNLQKDNLILKNALVKIYGKSMGGYLLDAWKAHLDSYLVKKNLSSTQYDEIYWVLPDYALGYFSEPKFANRGDTIIVKCLEDIADTISVFDNGTLEFAKVHGRIEVNFYTTKIAGQWKIVAEEIKPVDEKLGFKINEKRG